MIRLRDDMYIVIATAIINLKKNKLTSETLLCYLNSYGYLQDIQKINFILQTNTNSIQYFLNNNSTIRMARFTEINKIIQFIGEGVEENEDILLGDTKKLNVIAKNYVQLKCRKKIGKKAISKNIKSSINILQSKTVFYSSKFNLSLKTKFPAPETILLLNPPFQNFFNTQKFPQNKPLQHYIIDQLPYLENINDLDNLVSTIIIMHGQYQAFDDFQGHNLKHIMDLKMELIKLNIIITYIDLLNLQTNFIINSDGLQIINNINIINKNVINSIDKEFKNFIYKIERFWMNPYFDLNFKNIVYPVEQINYNVIYLNLESTVEFVLPPTSVLQGVNYNELLVLACLKSYFCNKVASFQDTLNNIFKHIEVIMAVTKFQFINKKYLKITLKNLIHQQCIIRRHSVSNYTLYKLVDKDKMELIISKFQNIEMINLILNITEEEYLITAIFYELPTTVYKYTNYTTTLQSEIQKKQLMGNIQQKVVFIKRFLNSITQSQNTTIETIHNIYSTKLTTYLQLLHTVLNILLKSSIDSLLTTDELSQYHKNSNLQLPSELLTTIPPTSPSKYLEQQLQTSHNKFYTRHTELQDYLNKYYN
ncbi:unnamed protein product [Aphis gossypii]|uniref:Uncharacterized protein n=1 Tax=Aphis gossypii TaxID=80765 RepID=A0A9P0IM40_APHGO|nr:unnamed protein product [Aphis gossypii]